MRIVSLVMIVVGLCAPARADDTRASARHLVSGVRLFKDGRYEEALVELRVVARAPDVPADLAFYLGPTLYKLGRYHEALAVFVGSRGSRDALTDFYLGETYYRLQLFRKARATFAGLRARGLGPVLDEAAGRYVDEIDLGFKASVANATIDYYIEQAHELEATDAISAAEYVDEARLLDAMSSAHDRHAVILAALGAAWNSLGRARQTIDLLAAEPSRAPEATWQLARAYSMIADPHARPALEAIVKAGGAHASEAATLLAKP